MAKVIDITHVLTHTHTHTHTRVIFEWCENNGLFMCQIINLSLSLAPINVFLHMPGLRLLLWRFYQPKLACYCHCYKMFIVRYWMNFNFLNLFKINNIQYICLQFTTINLCWRWHLVIITYCFTLCIIINFLNNWTIMYFVLLFLVSLITVYIVVYV